MSGTTSPQNEKFHHDMSSGNERKLKERNAFDREKTGSQPFW
jgi:hypothetical protein